MVNSRLRTESRAAIALSEPPAGGAIFGDLPQRGAIDIAEDIDIGARENRPKRWRDIWSAGHSTSGVSEVLARADGGVTAKPDYFGGKNSGHIARQALAAA
jgi:hypothetical protein